MGMRVVANVASIASGASASCLMAQTASAGEYAGVRRLRTRLRTLRLEPFRRRRPLGSGVRSSVEAVVQRWSGDCRVVVANILSAGLSTLRTESSHDPERSGDFFARPCDPDKRL